MEKIESLIYTIDLENVTRFADDDKMHNWSRPSIYAMTKKEIIKGIGDNKYDPLGVAKVEEALAISLRCYELRQIETVN